MSTRTPARITPRCSMTSACCLSRRASLPRRPATAAVGVATGLRPGLRRRDRVDRIVRGGAGALPARAAGAGARGQPAAHARTPAAGQERPGRRRDARQAGARRQRHHDPEANRRDHRVDPATSDRARERGEGAQRRDCCSYASCSLPSRNSSATGSPAARRSAARRHSACDRDRRPASSTPPPKRQSSRSGRSLGGSSLWTGRSPHSIAQSAAPERTLPPALLRTDPRLHGPPHHRREEQARDHPVSQTLHRARDRPHPPRRPLRAPNTTTTPNDHRHPLRRLRRRNHPTPDLTSIGTSGPGSVPFAAAKQARLRRITEPVLVAQRQNRSWGTS